MRKSSLSPKVFKLKLLFVGGSISFLASIAVLGPQSGFLSPPSQQETSVEELIKQARGLQKLGRWEKAAEILTKLATDGEPLGLYHLGRAYKNGWGVEADLDQARLLFMEAVRKPFELRGETAYELGRMFQRCSNEKCSSIALQWFLKSLEWEYPKAHVQLAKHYERGIGTEQDLPSALHHYERAAIAGYPSSTINFAHILSEGRHGTTPDEEKAQFMADRAISGLEKKARDGSASSAKTLARLYRDGEFTDPDPAKAKEWFLRSASLGDSGAMHDLGSMLLKQDDQDGNIEEGLKWLRLAAENQHGGALTALARLHLRKKYDLKQEDALGYLERAVSTGHPGAMEELARLHSTGLLVEQNMPKAIELARTGAGKGHRGSQKLLEQLENPKPSDGKATGKRATKQRDQSNQEG
ncbi:tetratricopeptide repeat protein [Roseibium sediminis]|uniref:tetratricopeptide repeat protein n=1 Tax=Roseibium sediminis TaxID=1775174 RepID=UPI00137617C5|nr:tetratricopeptide repeat protein [Roseibium sediminis]